MGCTQSNIENEETVTRCKNRKLFMKDAVAARNAFAAAHAAYVVSLRHCGAALSDYAYGEVLSPHLYTSAAVPSSASMPLPDEPPPPPPPLLNSPHAPLQRAASMPEFSMHKPDPIRSDPIIEEDEEEVETDTSHNLKHRSSSRRGSRSGKEAEGLGVPPPPSPPPAGREAPPPAGRETEAKGTGSWDFFFSSMENVPGPYLAEVDEDRMVREEMERKMYEERSKEAKEVLEDEDDEPKRNVKSEAAAAAAADAEVDDSVAELPPQLPTASKVAKKVKADPTENKRGGKLPTSLNLFQILTSLDDCFLKASESAHEVSKMLEANRLHYHSNFADNRGHIDHSARVLQVITWNRSFRGLQDANDGLEDFDSEDHETLATILDKMLAWEKKLYDEVKIGEQMKLDYQRKVGSLNKLKKRGASTEGIEKAKAAVSHLHTRYIVDMQSMDSTVSEINRLRDKQLYPKLVALVNVMAVMWKTMKTYHERQSKIVTGLKFLDISQSSEETSKHHHDRTCELLKVVEGWHSFFQKLITHQKEYIKALDSWLRLNLIPIDNNLKEKVSSPQRPQSAQIQTLLRAWHDSLNKLPDDVASTAISHFVAAMSTIKLYQEDELKLKFKCEETRKDLTRKTRQFEDWYDKFMQKRTPADEMDPDRAHDANRIAERQVVVETVKKKLEEEEEAYRSQCTQVREKSLTSLKTQLPELFRALLVFSKDSSDMYLELLSISQPE